MIIHKRKSATCNFIFSLNSTSKVKSHLSKIPLIHMKQRSHWRTRQKSLVFLQSLSDSDRRQCDSLRAKAEGGTLAGFARQKSFINPNGSRLQFITAVFVTTIVHGAGKVLKAASRHTNIGYLSRQLSFNVRHALLFMAAGHIPGLNLIFLTNSTHLPLLTY